jgi:NADPH-dependent glutamate synthase beta subunit-like oxidoreductase/NAD(P)H-flavin reductase
MTDIIEATQTSYDFKLGIEGFTYSDLYKPERLRALTEKFYDEVKESDSDLHERLTAYIAARGAGYEQKVESAIIVESAPHLSKFLARMFFVEEEREKQIASVKEQDPIWVFKFFINRRAIKKFPAEQAAELNAKELNDALNKLRRAKFPETFSVDDELGVAQMAARLLEDEKQKDDEAIEHLNLLERWAAAHFFQDEARKRVRHWVSFKQAHAMDFQNLVQIERPNKDMPEMMIGLDKNLRKRDGFKLTDKRYSKRENLYEIDYCIYCHERSKDSCSKGFWEKDGSARRNPLGIKLEGCPLEEKISEMHVLQKNGDAIGALAIIVIDNPMAPGTGHRICNDCMKACIFQKQDPVNIPQAETGILTDVLELPYGFEIYALLTRWNPLNAKRPYALPYNGKNVLVVGLGPAGYTLAHFLLNEGFGVVGIDGLKIEPLDKTLTGDGGRFTPKPIKEINEIESELDERILSGFGGVSEYGITVRWDKNFLTIINYTLARRDHFRFYGGTRFGGTLTIEDAWELGFDHIAIATGAGKPTIVNMKNNLIRGIRKASDFLMALQLTGAFKRDALANLQVRLPAVVIGGGLTAIDTATEMFAYYPMQVEKMFERHEKLVAEFGEEKVLGMFNDEEKEAYKEFLSHAKAIRAERERAREAGEEPDFVKLVRSWGGVSIIYRKRLQDSPSYRLNHEEVIKSLEEGITFIENMSPQEAVPDEFGAVKELIFERQFLNEENKWRGTGEFFTFPARTVCVAAGTSPNIIYEKEKPGTFKLDEWNYFFQAHKIVKDVSTACAYGRVTFNLVPASKGECAFFTSYEKDGRFITFYGDNHPIYAGNVVKAMASARFGYEQIVSLFEDELSNLKTEEQPQREAAFNSLIEYLDDALTPRVVRVDRLTPTIVDVIVRAPMQAKKFHPGQFYRLQNYETTAEKICDTKLTMEGIALTGAWTDAEKGLLSLIVLEMGTSSRLCATLKEGEQVVVMGPTGAPTEIPKDETVLLLGGGLGNAVLFSIAKALRENGNKVLYFAGYKNGADLFKREEIEAATDQVIWSTDTGVFIEPRRPQDAHYRGNIVQAMLAYINGELDSQMFDFSNVNRIIAIGSDRMMAAVKEARHGVLAPYLQPNHIGIGSINSPMQCMMKEVCAQCLQKHIDPQTGKEFFVFSCFNQDQLLDEVDFKNLNDRLRANSIQEKISNLWLDKLLKEANNVLV